VRTLLLAALIAVSCTTTAVPKPTIRYTPEPTPTPIATASSPLTSEETAAARTECARSVLTSFVDAFNAGDAPRLATFFTPTGPRAFQWFYTPETPPYGPLLSRLPDYFAAWHAAGESWRLVSLKSGDGPSWHGGVDFAVTVERTWPDRSVTSEGKGALDCTAGTIFVFAIGDP
jgi:hypothetical protein